MAAALDDPDFMMRKGVADVVFTGHALCFLATMSSIARRSGYPWAGCSPTEPASVSPKFFFTNHRNHRGGRL